MSSKHSLSALFTTFLKIGALTFGGGYAMMPVMRREVVDKKGWANDDDILKILVISETTPGVLAVNSATFIGYKIAGFKGSVAATLGVVLPSFVLIALISLFILQFKSLTWVNYAFMGLKGGVAVLIFRAGLRIARRIKRTWFALILFGMAFLIALFTSVSVIYILIAGGLIGLIRGYILYIKEAKQHVA